MKFVTLLPKRLIRPATLGLLLGLVSFVQQDDPTTLDETRFTPVLVAPDLDEPMAFEVTKDGTVYIIERKGAVKKYDPVTKSVELIATIPVNTKYTSKEGRVTEAEEGLMGISLDPNFEKNHWVYLYYAHPTEKKHILTRWTLADGQLARASEKVLLAVETQREVCCHTGGGMVWDKAGNLYLTVGNNTGNQQAAQTDERPGRSSWDDQGHAGNTMDLRGKPGVLLMVTQRFPTREAVLTVTTGRMQPGNPDPITRADARYAGASRHNRTDALVTRHQRQRCFDRPVTTDGVQVRMADATGGYLNQHRPNGQNGYFGKRKGLAVSA